MIHAYNELYLEQASNNFASMMDYAVNDCGLDGTTFLQMMHITGIDKYLEQGNPSYIAGRSGIEIAGEVLGKSNPISDFPVPENRYDKTPVYWAGWVLAQFQWYSALTFTQILRVLPFDAIIKLYPTHHEADITKFYATVSKVLKKTRIATNLKQYRTNRGYSQSELARISGVSLRSIQMYEQRRKDINKAQAMAVAALSKALSCDIIDLLEYAF